MTSKVNRIINTNNNLFPITGRSRGSSSIMSDTVRNTKNTIDLSEVRLFKILDTIEARLSNIENCVSKIGRLEERMSSQELIVDKYGHRLNVYSTRLRQAELWQASHNDNSSIERPIRNIQSDIININSKVDKLEEVSDKSTGQKTVIKIVIKWFMAIALSLVVFSITKK